jgi:aminopeptidase N
MERNYGVLASFEGALALAHFYPMLAVYDDEGWNTATPPAHSDVTFADASFYLVRVRAPARLVLVGSGRELSAKSDGGLQTVTYAAGPARDFYLAAGPDFQRLTAQAGEVTVNSYAPAGWSSANQAALDAALAALDFFSLSFSPYPYTELDLVAVHTLALGIEYPGLIAQNRNLYDPAASFGGTPRAVLLESTVAHEVGHQWFYNLVGNDQLDEPWLDESLTQYATWRYYTHRYGPEGEAGWGNSLDSRWDRVDHAPIPIGLPASSYSGAEYGAIVYGRGPFFFEALAEALGSAAFDTFLRDYVQTHQWQIATGPALKRLAEQHCACDLSALFDKWGALP